MKGPSASIFQKFRSYRGQVRFVDVDLDDSRDVVVLMLGEAVKARLPARSKRLSLSDTKASSLPWSVMYVS